MSCCFDEGQVMDRILAFCVLTVCVAQSLLFIWVQNSISGIETRIALRFILVASGSYAVLASSPNAT
jgi:hypothetical protein